MAPSAPSWGTGAISGGVCHVHSLTSQRPPSTTLPGSHPQTGCLGPLLQVSSVQRMKCRKGKRKREWSHPQLFSQVSLRRIKMLFGPTAQRQNRRWKYLFVSKALAIPGWKAHLDCNLLQPELLPWQAALTPGSRPVAQVLGQEVPPLHWKEKVGSLSQQKRNLLNENDPLLASGSQK